MYVLTGIRQLETCPHSCFDVVARKQELYGWVWRAGLTLQGLTWTVTYGHSQVVEWLVQQPATDVSRNSSAGSRAFNLAVLGKNPASLSLLYLTAVQVGDWNTGGDVV